MPALFWIRFPFFRRYVCNALVCTCVQLGGRYIQERGALRKGLREASRVTYLLLRMYVCTYILGIGTLGRYPCAIKPGLRSYTYQVQRYVPRYLHTEYSVIVCTYVLRLIAANSDKKSMAIGNPCRKHSIEMLVPGLLSPLSCHPDKLRFVQPRSYISFDSWKS